MSIPGGLRMTRPASTCWTVWRISSSSRWTALAGKASSSARARYLRTLPLAGKILFGAAEDILPLCARCEEYTPGDQYAHQHRRYSEDPDSGRYTLAYRQRGLLHRPGQ